MRQLLRRARHLLRRQADDDLAEEMELHRAMKAQELEARGVDRDEAHFAARRAFGSLALALGIGANTAIFSLAGLGAAAGALVSLSAATLVASLLCGLEPRD